MALKGDTTFAYRVFNKFLERIDERVRLVDELLPIKQDFTIDEEILIDPDQIGWARDDAERRDRWRKRIKHDRLELAHERPKSDDKTGPAADPTAAEVNAKLDSKALQEKISKRYHHLAKRMRQTNGVELLEMYLTALTTAYDPHTSYMSADSLENF